MTYKVTWLLHKCWKWLTKGRSMNYGFMTEDVRVLTIGKCFKHDSMQMCFVQRRLTCCSLVKNGKFCILLFFWVISFFCLFHIKEWKESDINACFFISLTSIKKVLDNVFPVDFLSSLDERYARRDFQIFWSLKNA